MPYGLYIAAEGAHAQSKRLEVVANNLANVDSAGFKRDLAIFQARAAESIQRGDAPPGGGTINDLGGGVQVVATQTDFSPGPLKITRSPTDMAIDGDGFFVVNKHGHPLLTRAGNFMLNNAGRLVDPTGDPVLNDNGLPIDIDPDGGPWQITPDGGIAQAGDVTYLAMVRPQSFADLAKQGENMFLANGPTTPVLPPDRHVLPERIEASGVQPTSEMMELIESTRAFEANVNLIRSYDQMMETLVSRVMKEA